MKLNVTCAIGLLIILTAVLAGCSGYLPYYLGVKQTSFAIIDDKKKKPLSQSSSWFEYLLCLSEDEKSFWSAGRRDFPALYRYDFEGNLLEKIDLPRPLFDKVSIAWTLRFSKETGWVYALKSHGRQKSKCLDNPNTTPSHPKGCAASPDADFLARSIVCYNIKSKEQREISYSILGEGDYFFFAEKKNSDEILIGKVTEWFRPLKIRDDWTMWTSRYVCSLLWVNTKKKTVREIRFPKEITHYKSSDSPITALREKMFKPFFYKHKLNLIEIPYKKKEILLPDGRVIKSTIP